MIRRLGMLVSISLLVVLVQSTVVLGITDLSGTKCSKVGISRTFKGVTYQCSRVGKTLKWKPVTSSKSAASTSTTTTTQSLPAASGGVCRTASQIYERLPNELQKREWESVVAKLQPIAATADSS